jgi:hypothetical protein
MQDSFEYPVKINEQNKRLLNFGPWQMKNLKSCG